MKYLIAFVEILLTFLLLMFIVKCSAAKENERVRLNAMVFVQFNAITFEQLDYIENRLLFDFDEACEIIIYLNEVGNIDTTGGYFHSYRLIEIGE